MTTVDESRLRSRHTWLIAWLVGMQLAAYLASVLDVLTIRAPERWLGVIMSGVLVAQCCLLSALTALGSSRWLLRSVCSAAIVVLAVLGIDGAEKIGTGQPFRGNQAYLICLFSLLMWGLIQLPFWLARLALGASAAWGGDLESAETSRAQYGLRHLMTLTLVFSLALGIGRWIIPAQAIEDIRTTSVKDWILYGTIAIALSLVASTSILAVLHVRYWQEGIAVSAASAALVAYGVYSTCSTFGSAMPADQIPFAAMIVCAYLWLLVSMLLVRAAGYRIIVRT